MNAINSAQLILLGKVLGAYDAFKWAQTKIEPANAELKIAQKDESHLGWFEDCGDFYREQTAKKDQVLSDALYYKRALERNFKKLRYEFMEQFPDAIEIMKLYPHIFRTEHQEVSN